MILQAVKYFLALRVHVPRFHTRVCAPSSSGELAGFLTVS